jgi:colanic acid/amylovoran biosynthesis glycosyltransferase
MFLEVEQVRVGYILKMFPRFSETFILTEILAQQAAGLAVEVISLRPPEDDLVHGGMRRLRCPLTYLPTEFDFGEFMRDLEAAKGQFPTLMQALEGEQTRGLDFLDVYQSILVARLAVERSFTHLHAHFGSVSTTVARLASRITGIPFSFTAHAKDIYHESVQPDDLRRKLADAAFVVTISEYNLRYLKENYGASAQRTFRLYNGLDLDQFRYSEPVTRPPRIVGVGRLIEKKGFADLIDACGILTGQGREVECEIIGAGALAGELRAQAMRLGLGERVRLLGPLTQEEVIKRVQSAAVLAAPCVEGSDGNIDGLPTVLLEAMALGTACVSTSVTGIPEVLRHEATGLMVPQHDASALADAISRLTDDDQLRVGVARRARQVIEQDFDIEHNAALLRQRFAVRSREPAAVSGGLA